MLCGYRSYSAIADWGHNYGAELAHALGFPHQPPCATTPHTALRRVDHDVVEAQLGAWVEGLLTGTPCAEDEAETRTIDGKTRLGSRQQGAPGAHLLAVLAPRLRLTLAQQTVADKTHAIPVVVDLLRHVLLEGRVVALDALLTQRHIAQQNVAAGDDVIVVQENQPQITYHPLCGWFEDAP